jgi:hypothetical protein
MAAMERAGATVAHAQGLDAALGQLQEWGLLRGRDVDAKTGEQGCPIKLRRGVAYRVSQEGGDIESLPYPSRVFKK